MIRGRHGEVQEMKKTILIISTLLSLASLALLERSIYAARRIGCSEASPPEDYTAASYSQNGLVCLFDAIENAGWGVHDGSASSWMNLIDERSFSIIHRAATDYEWTDSSFVRNQASYGYFVADYTEELQDKIRNGVFSFEIVTSSPVQSANWQAQILNICQTSEVTTYNKGIVAACRREDIGRIQVPSLCKYWRPNLDYDLPGRSDLATATFTYDGSAIRMYVNGSLHKMVTFSPDSSLDGAVVRLGSTTYAFRGSYHCIRVYDRTLSDEEVKSNFKVDEKRFGVEK